MPIAVSIPSEETAPTEDEVEEAKVSPYFENYVQTASGEKLAQKQFKASADF
jgi:hypothetical protein